MADKAAYQAEVLKVNVTAKTVNQEVVERKVLCLTPGGPASTLTSGKETSFFSMKKCVRQKAHGWESAEVIVGTSAIPKDLM